jgi:hypothetical protein
MHYASNTFSAAGAPVALLRTPRADGSRTILGARELSVGDVRAIAQLYGVGN